jgi:Predicted solute binding protein
MPSLSRRLLLTLAFISTVLALTLGLQAAQPDEPSELAEQALYLPFIASDIDGNTATPSQQSTQTASVTNTSTNDALPPVSATASPSLSPSATASSSVTSLANTPTLSPSSPQPSLTASSPQAPSPSSTDEQLASPTSTDESPSATATEEQIPSASATDQASPSVTRTPSNTPTPTPRVGYWQGTSNTNRQISFYVVPAPHLIIENLSIQINQPCTAQLNISFAGEIIADEVEYYGSSPYTYRFQASFDSTSQASGSFEIIGICGGNGASLTWTANWVDGAQPTHRPSLTPTPSHTTTP